MRCSNPPINAGSGRWQIVEVGEMSVSSKFGQLTLTTFILMPPPALLSEAIENTKS